MKLYLLRHAPAEERDPVKYPDDDRPLTEEGRAKIEQAAPGIVELLPNDIVICSSPLKRAAQTAAPISKAYKPRLRVNEIDLLKPNSSRTALMRWIRNHRAESLLLVGHEPDLGLLAASLLHAPGVQVEFKKGALMHIEFPERGAGRLVWFLPPKLLRQ